MDSSDNNAFHTAYSIYNYEQTTTDRFIGRELIILMEINSIAHIIPPGVKEPYHRWSELIRDTWRRITLYMDECNVTQKDISYPFAFVCEICSRNWKLVYGTD